MLASLSRYTHRVAISNSRLIALDDKKDTFKWKDYRAKDGDLHKTIALPIPEFIRRFFTHVPPQGFHRKAVATPGPPASRLARSSRSSRPRNNRQPPCRRQISIDRTGRTAAPDPPAVPPPPEACPTPADRVRATRPVTAGVR